MLASIYTPGRTWEKSAPNLLLGNAHMEAAHFKKQHPKNDLQVWFNLH